MIDLDRGWSTERLDLEPLVVAHATELAPLLDDTSLHEFTGGAPLSAAALTARYARLAARRSPDGGQMWGNWVIRVRATGMAAGTVQATLPAGGPAAGPAEVAWVVARPAQGSGYATEAARSLVALLHAAGWSVVAHIHPGHLASQRVARAAGLSPTAGVRDGEIRWASPPAAARLHRMLRPQRRPHLPRTERSRWAGRRGAGCRCWRAGLSRGTIRQMTDRAVVRRWLASYEAAWRAPGTRDLAGIFTGDASYRQSPYQEPVVGLDAIMRMWEEERDGPDEVFTLATEIVAVDGPAAVVRAEVRYGDPVRQEYRDLWIMRLGEDGRCDWFEEWPYWPVQPGAARG